MMAYDEYKATNEYWLPNIPSNWNTMKLKHFFKERVEKGYPEKPLLAATQNMGVVPKNIYGNRTVEVTKDFHLLKLVQVGDFVISLRSFQGGIEYAYYEGIISPAYTILTPIGDNNSNYFRYLFKTFNFIALLQNCVTGIREGQNVDYQKLRTHHIAIPPRPEQDQIVRFLDWKFDFAQQNPILRPPYLDMNAFTVDFNDAHGLWTILNTIQQLHESIDDTEMLAGSEAYQAALTFYHSVKAAVAQDVPGAKAVYEELRKRFPQGGRKKGGSETETVTETIKKEVKLS